jgi:hypothetical protein
VSGNSRTTGNCRSPGGLLKAVPLPLRFADGRMQCSRHLPPPPHVPAYPLLRLSTPRATMRNRTICYPVFWPPLHTPLHYFSFYHPLPSYSSSFTYDFVRIPFVQVSNSPSLASSAVIQAGSHCIVHVAPAGLAAQDLQV